MLVVIFQMNVMIAQTNFANNQQRNIKLNLKFEVPKENVIFIKIKKNTSMLIEKNEKGFPFIVTG
jgi:hypothetical protein